MPFVRHADTLALAKDSLSGDILKLKPMSVPNFDIPNIPFDMPPVNIPPITVPHVNLPPVVPTMPSARSPRRQPATGNDRARTERPVERATRRPAPSRSSGGVDTEKRANGKLQAARNFLADGKQDLARQWLETLIRDYPDSAAAKAARDELKKLP